jgi:serine protease Do
MLVAIAIASLGACAEKEQAPPAQTQSHTPAASSGSGTTIELPSFVTLVKKEAPVVVNVTTVRTVRQSAEAGPGVAPDDPMYEFFRRFMPPPATPLRSSRRRGVAPASSSARMDIF